MTGLELFEAYKQAMRAEVAAGAARLAAWDAIVVHLGHDDQELAKALQAEAFPRHAQEMERQADFVAELIAE